MQAAAEPSGRRRGPCAPGLARVPPHPGPGLPAPGRRSSTPRGAGTEGRLNFQDQLMLAAALLREEPGGPGPISASASIPSSSTSSRTPIPSRPRSCSSSPGARATRARPDRTGLDLVQARAGGPLPRRRSQAVDLPVPAGRHRHLQPGQGPRSSRSGGEVLELSANYRSLGAIAELGQPALRSRGGRGFFRSESDAYQAGFIRLDADAGARPAAALGRPPGHGAGRAAARQGTHRRLRFAAAGRLHRLGPGRQPHARGGGRRIAAGRARAISSSSSATSTA